MEIIIIILIDIEMKILHVINSLQMGGAEKLISDIVPRFIALGYEVDVAIFDTNETFIFDELKKNGIVVRGINRRNSYPYSIINLLKLMFVIRKYDIIHSHTTPAQLFTMISHFLVSSKTKIVTTEHSTNNHRRGKWLYKIIDKIMYSRYNHIICISETAKKNLVNHIGNPKNITVVENGIDINKFQFSNPLSRDVLGIKNTDFILTMVGRFCDAKDQDTVIKALSLLPKHCKLLLVGDGNRKPICENLVKELGVTGRVLFLGIRNDIPQILHTSDIVIMSSHWEGLSLSSVEGMSVNKPFLASNVEGLKEVVDGAGVLFQEGNSQQLAKIILELMNDKDLYSVTAKKCLERARKYDISQMVTQYSLIYQKLK